MADQKDLKEFPDLSNKLAAPTKKSLFERQKAEAEAKRVREEAETAAVYKDFVKSFEDEDTEPQGTFGDVSRIRAGLTAPAGPRSTAGPPKRHFAPGSSRLSNGPGSLGPLPSAPRKRAADGLRAFGKETERGIFAYDEPSALASTDTHAAFRAVEDEEDVNVDGKAAERAAPKPTLQMTSLPPGTSPAVIKSLLPTNLTVDAVRIITPAGSGSATSTERRSMSAIVTLAKDTPGSEIDTAVNTLQNKYLGWGFYLSLSRHLSSAALGSMGSSGGSLHSALSSLPFGARPVPQAASGSMSRAPPPGSYRGGFAPPSSYAASGVTRGAPPVQVTVTPPSDIQQLRLIHKTVEAMLTHGPDFEALLMSRPEVQHDERWGWLWDSRSTGGVWYRWRLWDIITGANSSKTRIDRLSNSTHRLFQGGAPWLEPEEGLQFEFTTHLDDFISDSEYNSSDEEDSGEEDGPRKRRRQLGGQAPPAAEGGLITPADEQRYLNPLQRAKLAHLLGRLPSTTARLRKGDVARITSFAITQAGSGAHEVVDMLTSNVLRPFSSSRGINWGVKDAEDTGTNEKDGDLADGDAPEKERKEKEDTSSASLIGLYLVSDILSASSTSGVRHAWRYRSLFEAALSHKRIFARLARMERTFGWGRLRAEKWKRSVSSVLTLWEGWCVFPAATHESFVEEFNNPPLTEAEKQQEKVRLKEKEGQKAGTLGAAKSKWKSVDANEAATPPVVTTLEDMDVDGVPMADEDLDGDVMEEEEDVDGEPMPDEELDGESFEDDDEVPHGKAGDIESHLHSETMSQDIGQAEEANAGLSWKKKPRPKAEDMFAESDED